MTYSVSPNPTPYIPQHPIFDLLGEPAAFLVMTNTHPPLSLCQQLPHPPLCPCHLFTPHSSNYIIYIDNISNLGRLRPGH